MKIDSKQRKSFESVRLWGVPLTELADIVLLYLVSRGILTLVGMLSMMFVGRQRGNRLEWLHPRQAWLDVWGQWDTGWYIDIARNWYSTQTPFQSFSNYAFFPVYPTLMKLLGALIGSHYIAGLLISNAALLAAAILLYKFVLLDHDREVAGNSVKYLFLFPSSFVLSGVLTEGLFLLLLVASFYQARQNAWLKAGMLGFLLSLTRVIGVCFSLPALYEYLKARNFSLRAIKPDILALALVPAGLLLFMAYNYSLTGDLLAFSHIQFSAWGKHFENPFKTLLYGMAGVQASTSDIVSAWFTGLVLAALAVFYRKVPVSQMLFCLLAIFIPLSTGLPSMPRYIAVVFPIYILFAQLGKDRRVDMAFTVLFALLQGCLMIFWASGTNLII